MRRKKLVAGILSVVLALSFLPAGMLDGISEVKAAQAEPLVQYDMTRTNDGKLADITGNGYDAKLVGVSDADFGTDGSEVVWNMTGSTSKYAELPRGVVTDDNFTIHARFTVATAQNQFLWGLGTGAGTWKEDNVGDYIFLNPKQPTSSVQAYTSIRSGIKVGSVKTKEVTLDVNEKILNTNTWYEITMTSEAGKLSMYLDGVYIGGVEHSYAVADVIPDSGDVVGYIGKSLFTEDKGYSGKLDKLQIFDQTLSAEEVEALISSGDDDDDDDDDEDQLTAEEAAELLTIPNQHDIRGNITLLSELKGTQISWTSSNEAVISTNVKVNEGYDDTPAGVVTRQQQDTVVTLKAEITAETDSAEKEFTVTVKAKSELASDVHDYNDYYGYIMMYFTGEGYEAGEQVYFATSRDGLNWTELNEWDGTINQPVLTSEIGTRGVRDPHIVRAPEGDKFYLIGTDLRVKTTGWNGTPHTQGSKSLIVWETTDLVNYSEPRLVEVAPDNAGCAWAPESFYDKETGEYIVTWASTTDVDNFGRHKVYYSKTRDFYTFTDPEVYIDWTPYSVIDTTIIEHDGWYYRFNKNETDSSGSNPWGKKVKLEKVEKLLHSEPVEIESSSLLNIDRRAEGPCAYKLIGEEKWVLLLDKYGYGGYYPMTTEDLDGGEFSLVAASDYKMPMYNGNKGRHGTVIPITEEEYRAVMKTWADEETANELELEDLVTEAAEYAAADYTAESYAALRAAVAQAQTALAGGDAEQIEAALTALQAAIEGLVPAGDEGTGNYVLDYYLNMAKSLNTDNMLSSARAELEAAINYAETLNAESPQADIVKAVVKLVLAIAKCEWEYGDVTALKALAEQARIAVTAKPDHEAAEAVRTALAKADRILEDPEDYFQWEIQAVLDELQDAYDALMAADPLDWSELNILLLVTDEIMDLIDQGVFITGVDEFKAAYDAALDLYDAEVIQDDIDAAVEKLAEALAGLRMAANKKYLAASIADAKAVLAGDLSFYTPFSVMNLKAALDDGEAVMAEKIDEDGQSRVDETKAAIDKALARLTPINDQNDEKVDPVTQEPDTEEPDNTDRTDSSDKEENSKGGVTAKTTTAKKSDGGSAKTGDNIETVIWLVLAAGALAAAYMLKRRRAINMTED